MLSVPQHQGSHAGITSYETNSLSYHVLDSSPSTLKAQLSASPLLLTSLSQHDLKEGGLS